MEKAALYNTFNLILSFDSIEDDTLIKLQKDGCIKKYKNNYLVWSYKSNDFNVDASLAIGYKNNQIFLTNGSYCIKNLDFRTGSLIWQKQVNELIRGYPLSIKDQILIQSMNSNIYILEQLSGQISWYLFYRNLMLHHINDVYMLLSKDYFIINYLDKLAILDLSFKNIENFYLNLFYDRQNNTTMALGHTYIKDKTLIFYDIRGYLYKIDLQNLSVIWQKFYKINRPFIVSSTCIIAIDEEDNILSIDQKNGRPIWCKSLSTALLKNIYKNYFWNISISNDANIYIQNNDYY